jgi:hypothetical protein
LYAKPLSASKKPESASLPFLCILGIDLRTTYLYLPIDTQCANPCPNQKEPCTVYTKK